MPAFAIHPRLLQDCHHLGQFSLAHVLLQRNAALPWFVLVPDVDAAIVELHQLAPGQRRQLEAEQDCLANFLLQRLGAEKLNIAAIGNIVPQLHLHVIGRRRDDPCWPGVVWGRTAAGPGWPAGRLAEIWAELLQCAAVSRASGGIASR